MTRPASDQALRLVSASTSPETPAHIDSFRQALTAVGWSLRPEPVGAPVRAVFVWADEPLGEAVEAELAATAAAGTPVLLAGPTLRSLPADGELVAASGVLAGHRTPAHEVRVRGGAAMIPAWSPALLADRVLLVDKVADDVEVLLTATVGRVEHPLATYRPSTRVATWTLDLPADPSDRTRLRLLVLLLRRLSGLESPRALRVGLLGYGAIGPEHTRATLAVPGLELTAVCDRAADRLAVAGEFAPEAVLTPEPARLLGDDIDLVVVSTPPDTHAGWALRALEAGKHVVVEKPFTLTTVDADAVLEAAARHDRLAVVYQNRRFDPDYLALRRVVAAGQLGELFHVETFVGGYGHPCNYWHSDEAVSGGAVYDWGAHLLDQLLDLVPGDVEHVTACEHKRVWHDVTNADHSRVTMRFTSGAEAEFVQSDLAAALKPRWYVLGTQGAVVGRWRTERVVARTDIGTLAEDVLAPADSPPLLSLHAPDGSMTELATPAGPPYPFHQELADRLLLGLPMTVTGAQSRRVVAVLEAAGESARSAGRPVVPS